MNTNEAWELVGGLSAPSKMPCYGYSIPAKHCITGGKLHDVKNSVCSKCYALKGNYMFPVVVNALEKRFKSLKNSQWVQAMITVITGKESSGYYRWHDSGDIQGIWHLQKIVEVCKALPKIKFWLPTREYSFVSEYLKTNSFPKNLTVRLSGFMLDGPAPVELAKRLGLTTSGVSKDSYTCPASKQGNQCLSCRACWDKSVLNINYKQH